MKRVTTISNICTNNLLVWKCNDQKIDIKWMYLLCFVVVDTVFYFVGQISMIEKFPANASANSDYM